jgi:hypothetical protein
MGTWGAGPFENDEASDWVYELETSRDASILERAFAAVTDLSVDDSLEAPESQIAIGAAETAAALAGRGGNGLPDSVVSWTLDRAPATRELLSHARAALARIRLDSELKELWEESESAAEWESAMTDLASRLGR